jgi:GntP family gluconate:H+ symporter
MASILGQCLMEARGAERIVAAIERLVGRRRAAFAFLGAGFLLGIPMFAEAVFYLLLPLAKASWRETRRHGVLLVLSIVAGATMTHSLVPPTPGPLFVADEMGIDIALMMRQGMIVGAIAALAGFGYATWADRHFAIPLRTAGEEGPATASDGKLPALWASLLPILLPVVLISVDSAVDSMTVIPASVARIIHFVGDKNLALTASAAAAILLLACRPGASREKVRQAVAAAVLEGGEIILVIAAGGALGATLRQAGMAELAAAAVPKQALLLLPIAWGVTVLIRAAQGSATVAMITAGIQQTKIPRYGIRPSTHSTSPISKPKSSPTTTSPMAVAVPLITLTKSCPRKNAMMYPLISVREETTSSLNWDALRGR